MGSFDAVMASETNSSIRLDELCHSNVGFFTEKTIDDSELSRGPLGIEGVYLFWHKDAYCDVHDLFHMRALYVGKGKIFVRLASHWQNKDFSNEMIVYYTYIEMPNRHAKFTEQLLLDTFDFPFNKAENRGKERLCAYFSQVEVDF